MSRQPYAILYSLQASTRVFVVMLTGLMLLPALITNAGLRESFERGFDLALIGCAAWIVLVLVGGLENSLALRMLPTL